MNTGAIAHSVILFGAIAEVVLVALITYVFMRYMRARRQRDQLRNEKEVIYGFMHDVGEVFAGADSVSPDALLKRVLFYALRTCRATAGTVYLYEGESERMHARAVSGVFPPLTESVGAMLDAVESKSRYVEHLVRTRTIMRGEGLVGQVADLGAPVLIQDAENDPRVPRHDLDFLRIHSVLLVPLRYQNQTLGVLAVVNRVDGRAFSEADQSLLQALSDQVSASVHYAGLRDVLAEKKRIDHDLAVARQIQSSLLPENLPHVPGLEIAAFNEPAQQIGGDYYDFLLIDSRHLGIVIADVAGKGIAGALMMTICRSVLRAQAPGNLSPAGVLRAMNRVMNKDIADEMFVTVLYMILDLETLDLVIARAGHERPILVGRGEARRIDSPGAAIGLVDDATFDALLGEVKVALQPGEVLVACTDGITDAMNAAGEEWGEVNFTEVCTRTADEGAHSLISHVREAAGKFVGGREQYDDMTLLAVRKIR